MSRKKKKAKKQDSSMFDVDKMFRGIGNQFNILLRLNKMSDSEREKFEEAWRRAKPKHYKDATEAEQRVYDEEQNELHREAEKARPWDEIRESLDEVMECMSHKPHSELFKTAKELLDMVDRGQMEPSSVGAYEAKKFDTGLKRLILLVNAESEAEQEQSDEEAGAVQGTDIWEGVSPVIKKAIKDFERESQTKKSERKRLLVWKFCQKRRLDKAIFKSERDKVRKRKDRLEKSD